MTIVNSSSSDISAPPDEWLFDPFDREREQIGLRNILEAFEAWEGKPST